MSWGILRYKPFTKFRYLPYSDMTELLRAYIGVGVICFGCILRIKEYGVI